MSALGKESNAYPSEVGDENDDHEYETDEDEENISRPLKKQKCTSKVSGDVKEVTTSESHCTECLHKNVVNKENISSIETAPHPKSRHNASGVEYDREEVREALSRLIILHELPFKFAESKSFNGLMKSVNPRYMKIIRARAKKHCLFSFGCEKEEVMSFFYQLNVNRVSVTTDLWKSGEDVLYMVVMCQFVDFELNLQKRILNLCKVPPPHSGLVLSDMLHKCLVEWKIEKKVWTVTVDNAACNDVAVRILRENLSYNKNLPFNGRFFHVRCYAQMINLVAEDGLSAIKEVIFKVRESVKYVVASEMRITMFSEIAKQLELSSKKLVLDRCTRWIATYAMLSAALDLKDVFSKYQQQDTSFALLPSEKEWEEVRVVCLFLEAFNRAKHLQPGTICLTSNLFLYEFAVLRRTFHTINVGEDTCMIDMVTRMKAKLDKYWRDCNLLMCVAAVLDPRFKMKLIDICLKDIYSSDEADEYRNTFLKTLHLLYDEYVEADKATKAKTDKKSSDISGPVRPKSFFDEYLEYLKTEPVKSELDQYLEESPLNDSKNFDALSWWRKNNSAYSRYKILPRMAYDVLSIPLTTLTSESAFDAGSRVVDPHYASKGLGTAQFLLCGGDWFRTRYGYKRTSQEKEGIEEIDLSRELNFIENIGGIVEVVQ